MNEFKIEILSVDITYQCHKGCPFCYNQSTADEKGRWEGSEVISFAKDCISHGVKAISLGGGEPFEHPEIFHIISELYPLAYLTITTNGLLLENEIIKEKLKVVHPDKIHISIHAPGNTTEVNRVIRQVRWLEEIGIKPGINLLVTDTTVQEAKNVFSQLRKFLNANQIILLPMRYGHTPSAADLALVADHKPFQSASCLLSCQKPTNFASVTWDKKAGWCSFTPSKTKLKQLTYKGLSEALHSHIFQSCQSPVT